MLLEANLQRNKGYLFVTVTNNRLLKVKGGYVGARPKYC